MSAYIRIPNYCTTRGYICLSDMCLGLVRKGSVDYLSYNNSGYRDFSIFSSSYFSKLSDRATFDVCIEDEKTLSEVQKHVSSIDIIDNKSGLFRLNLFNRSDNWDFYWATPKEVTPEIWIHKGKEKITIIQDEDYNNSTIFNTLELTDHVNLILNSLNPLYIYGAVLSRIRHSPSKTISGRSIVAWAWKDKYLTYLTQDNTQMEGSVISFDNLYNFTGAKENTLMKVEFCLTYIRKRRFHV